MMLASLNQLPIESKKSSWNHSFRKNKYEIKNSKEMVQYIQEKYSYEKTDNPNKLIDHVSGDSESVFLVACRYANSQTVDYLFQLFNLRLNYQHNTFVSQTDNSGRNLFMSAAPILMSTL